MVCSAKADGRDSFQLCWTIRCTTESLQAVFRALSTGVVLPVMVPEIEGAETPCVVHLGLGDLYGHRKGENESYSR